MPKYLGQVLLGDNKALQEIVEELGYSIDEESGLPYYNLEAVWDEARNKLDETGDCSCEVKVDGLDFIIVY